MESFERYIIRTGSTLADALRKLNTLPGGEMTLFVVGEPAADGRSRLLGTLTDGDIRRALISGLGLDSSVDRAMHTGFKYLTTKDDSDDVDAIRAIRKLDINLVPRIDETGCPVEILDLRKTRTRLPLSAILMAGGKGERLRPMTLTTPKPLLEIDGKAIIDYNIIALIESGITDITVITRYLAEQIEEHFSKPIDGVKVKCITESDPLGTIGGTTLVSRPDEGDTLVMNSDLLTTLSFEDMYIRHRDEKADITVAVIPYQVSVPFAILTTRGAEVTGIEEKPSYSYFANAGIYIISNCLLNSLRPDERIDATDLIERAIADGKKVVYQPVNGTWIDIGSPTDFAHAKELMRHLRNFSNK